MHLCILTLVKLIFSSVFSLWLQCFVQSVNMYKHVCDVSKLKLTVEDLIKYYKPATSVGLGMAGPAHGRVFIVHVTVY